MPLPHYSSLNELIPLVKEDWKINVQIFRKWKDYVPKPDGQAGLNVIVVDNHVSLNMFNMYRRFCSLDPIQTVILFVDFL